MVQLIRFLLVVTGILPALMLVSRGGGFYWGLASSDLVNTFYPWRVFLHRWLERGVLPKWDPHVFHGYPVMESQQMAALHPVQMLAQWTLPVEWGMILQGAVLCVFGFVAFYFFMRRGLGFSSLLALGGANLWIYSAPFAVHFMAGHFTIQTALASWPIALMGIALIVRDVPTTGRWQGVGWIERAAWLRKLPASFWRIGFLFAAAGNAFTVLAGAPQFVVYLFYAQLGLLLGLSKPGRRLSALAALGFSWVAGLVLSLPQWLPTLWYLPYSSRGAAGSMYMSGSSWDRAMVMEWLMPYPFGDDLIMPHMHLKNVWEVTPYTGAGVLMLLASGAFYGAVCVVKLLRGQHVVFPRALIAGLVVSALAIAMIDGTGFPGMSSFREPGKARAVLSLGAIVTAMSFIRLLPRLSFRGAAMPIGMAVAGLVGALIYLVWPLRDLEVYRNLVISFGSPVSPTGRSIHEMTLAETGLVRERVFASMMWTLGGAAVVIGSILISRNRRLAGPLVLLLLVADPVLVHFQVYAPRHPFNKARGPEQIEQYFAPILAEQRSKREPPFSVVLDSSLNNATHFVEGLYENSGYDPILPAHAMRYAISHQISTAGHDNQARREIARAVTGIRYDYADWTRTEREAGIAPVNLINGTTNSLVELTGCVKLGEGNGEKFGPLEDGRTIISRTSLNAKNEVEWLDEVEGFSVECGTGGESVEATPDLPPDRIELIVKTSAPLWAIYKGTWLPGWEYRVDEGDWEAAYCANLWGLAAPVPAGEHGVEFRYIPVYWAGAVWGAWIGWGILALSVVARISHIGRIRLIGRK